MKNFLKILQGPPGSGKTDYIRNQIDTENWPRYAMICGISQYTEEVITNSLPHLRQLSAKALCFRRAMDLIVSKAPFVIIDNSNIIMEDVAPYVLLAKSYDYDFEIICVATSPVDLSFSNL